MPVIFHLRLHVSLIDPWFYCVPLNTFFYIQFSHSVMSDSLQPHGPQHARPPCPSPTPGVHPSPCPLSQWCHPTFSSSVVPFSSCLQSFPASGSFQISQFFTSDGQNIGISASASVTSAVIFEWFCIYMYIYSVTLFIVINCYLHIRLLLFSGVFLFFFSFFFLLPFFFSLFYNFNF